MKLPELSALQTTREMIDAFGGYNHNLRIKDGEFYDMENLSSDDYPVLSVRKKRGVYVSSLSNYSGMIGKNDLCYVDGDDSVGQSHLYINQIRQDLSLDAKTEKTLVSMGSYIIILPDKKYINTANTNDKGSIELRIDIPRHQENGAKVIFSPSKIDGTPFENPDGTEIQSSNTPPGNPAHCSYWIDTSGDTAILKIYSQTTSRWTSVASTYIKIEDNSSKESFTEKGLRTGDSITISGINGNGALAELNTTMVVRRVSGNSIIVQGFIDKVYEQVIDVQNGEYGSYTDGLITIERRMPDMDFVIESGNRLWGCRYGTDDFGRTVNEIYASKLGDFKNWYAFDGISTDSYTVSVGSDGAFTGAIEHLGYPVFFKENCYHKVYGNYPSNYQVQTTACRGVQEGCEKSLAIVNETLYYKARNAICAYDGSLPVEVSSALGEVNYSEAVGGALGNKYYVSMKDGGGGYHLFVLDTAKGMWHKEDNLHATDFCTLGNELYFHDHERDQIMTVLGTEGVVDDAPIAWNAITGIIGTDSPDKKYISRLDIRLMLNLGSKVTIYAEYDSSGVWEHLFTIEGKSLRSFAVPIRPKRCDHLRLKLEGAGDAKVYSICKTIEQGSDM